MKTVHTHHLHQTALRKLTIASCIGGFLSLLFGAWIAAWIWSILLWLPHRLPTTFPLPGHVLMEPNLWLGLAWLGYYVLAYLWAKVTRSPRQKMQQRIQLDRQYQAHYGEWSLHDMMHPQSNAVPKKEPAALSQAWPGELKHQLVEQCYHHYRKALMRFDPPPIELRTPETFFYRKAGDIEWRGSTLILPEEVLTPERIHELLPFLAHFLADYNTEHIMPEETDAFPDYVPWARLLAITGNFLWLPVIYKHKTEGQRTLDSITHQRQQILERDEFAVLLGQGPALEHQLRRVEAELKQRGQRDTNLPTLIERIGRLEVLNAREREDMRALGLSPQEPPLVTDPPGHQIGKRKNQSS